MKNIYLILSVLGFIIPSVLVCGITFSLEGNAEMPGLPPPYFPQPIVDPNFVIDDALALKGANEYWKCFNCHGDGMFGGGMAPDRRKLRL